MFMSFTCSQFSNQLSLFISFCTGDKGYGEWAPWSECSVSCNAGQKTRSRQCTIIDPPKDICQGASSETTDCNIHKCPGTFSSFHSAMILEKLYILKVPQQREETI